MILGLTCFTLVSCIQLAATDALDLTSSCSLATPACCPNCTLPEEPPPLLAQHARRGVVALQARRASTRTATIAKRQWRNGKLHDDPENNNRSTDASARHTLASIVPHPAIDLGGGYMLQFQSLVPVFDPDGSYVAMLQPWSQPLWELTINQSHVCDFPAGGGMDAFSAEVEKIGGAQEAPYKRFMVWRCAVPFERRNDTCINFTLKAVSERNATLTSDDAPVLGNLAACHNAPLAQTGPYKLAACVTQAWEDPEHLESSGFTLMPQWVEYNYRRGVEHFFVYARNNRSDERDRMLQLLQPYLEIGIASLIEIDGSIDRKHDDHNLEANDCLYRAKGRVEWLMPHIEFDEYMHWPQHDQPFLNGLPRVLDRRKAAAHTISFGRYNFVHPNASLSDLQISSPYRDSELAPLCPKYFSRTQHVHALFNHWPTSWDRGTQNVHLPQDEFVAFHYRGTPGNASKIHGSEFGTLDTTLANHSTELAVQLQKRYGVEWTRLYSPTANGTREVSLLSVNKGTRAHDSEKNNQSSDLEEEVAKKYSQWIRALGSAKGVVAIAPPS